MREMAWSTSVSQPSAQSVQLGLWVEQPDQIPAVWRLFGEHKYLSHHLRRSYLAQWLKRRLEPRAGRLPLSENRKPASFVDSGRRDCSPHLAAHVSQTGQGESEDYGLLAKRSSQLVP